MSIKNKKIYLDYAATTPIDPLVKKTMLPYFSDSSVGKFGNPSSLHSFGQEALAAVDEAREKIAKAINADFREIIFTGSATEANNLALRGVLKTKTHNLKPCIIVSTIEHESILETCRDLEKDGVEIIYLPVNKQGLIDLRKLKASLNERTVLISIMYANNEIGTIQPIAEIAKIIKEFKKESSTNYKLQTTNYPLLHTDAVQAFQFLDCDVNKLGVDLMTLSGHKIYGPKGVGALYARTPYPNPHTLNPIITGGGQEFGFRSGTENVPAIVGFAKAVEIAVQNRKKEMKRIAELADYFWKGIKKISPKAEINGYPTETQWKLNGNLMEIKRLPNILNIYLPDQNSEELLMKMDLNGIAASAGSACSARATKLSHVLKAIGLPNKKIKSGVRFSFGKFTTKEELKRALKIIKKVI